MTIIVAFILDAFVFRMNYSRKNKQEEALEDPEGSKLSCFLFFICIYFVMSLFIAHGCIANRSLDF